MVQWGLLFRSTLEPGKRYWTPVKVVGLIFKHKAN